MGVSMRLGGDRHMDNRQPLAFAKPLAQPPKNVTPVDVHPSNPNYLSGFTHTMSFRSATTPIMCAA